MSQWLNIVMLNVFFSVFFSSVFFPLFFFCFSFFVLCRLYYLHHHAWFCSVSCLQGAVLLAWFKSSVALPDFIHYHAKKAHHSDCKQVHRSVDSSVVVRSHAVSWNIAVRILLFLSFFLSCCIVN